MKKYPNADIKKCRVRSHAKDAVYCHLCGAKLVESIEDDKTASAKPDSGHYGIGEPREASTTGPSRYRSEDGRIDILEIIKCIIAIFVVIGVLVLIIKFWKIILAVIAIIIIMKIIRSN